jgi:hypothetical protein
VSPAIDTVEMWSIWTAIFSFMAGLRRLGWTTVLPVQAHCPSANRDIPRIGTRHPNALLSSILRNSRDCPWKIDFAIRFLKGLLPV